MARINIEDSIRMDARFFKLAQKLGGFQPALGAVTWAWMVAQKHYLCEENDRCIPYDDWQVQECSDAIIEVGLAEKREKGVYVKGSEEQFRWLLRASEGGKRSGKVRAEEANEGTSRVLEGTSSTFEGTSRVPEGTRSSISISSSTSNSKDLLRRGSDVADAPRPAVPVKKDDSLNKRTQEAVAIWARAYKERYKANPPLGGKQVGQIRTLVKDHGFNEASELLQAYLQLSDKDFVDKCHSLDTLFFKLNRVMLSKRRGIESPQAADSWDRTLELIRQDEEAKKCS